VGLRGSGEHYPRSDVNVLGKIAMVAAPGVMWERCKTAMASGHTLCREKASLSLVGPYLRASEFFERWP